MNEQNLLINNIRNDWKWSLNIIKIKQIDQNDFLHQIQMITVSHSCCMTAKKIKCENQRCFCEKSCDVLSAQHHHHSKLLMTHSLVRTHLSIDCTEKDD